jgi:hypothetical protein
MTNKSTIVFAALALFLAGQMFPPVKAQETSGPVKAVHLMGVAGIKDQAKGTLKVENGDLQFVHGGKHSDLGATSIQDVVTGADSEKTVGNTIGMMSMAAPYGGGRFLSLFRKKIDTLSIQYRDDDGALHGAIFTMPVGAAEGIKKELVAQGAATASTGEPNQGTSSASSPLNKKEMVAVSQEHTTAKIRASAVQVEMIQSDEIKLPAEFRIALYENLVRQLQKAGKFQHIYRDGDSNASGAAEVVVLHSSVRGFKAGSERARQVTTVAGATSITVHCRFTGAEGQSLLERDVNGKVRFFGGNPKATYDFAKKAAHITVENFSAGAGKQ